MIPAQNMKFNMLIYPQSVATNATATATVDTEGWDHLQVYVAGDTASSAISTLKLSEGTDTSAATDIDAFTGGNTSVGFTIPSADATNGVSVLLDVDTNARERYIKISCTPGATQVVSATAVLSRGKIGLTSTASEHGVDTYHTA